MTATLACDQCGASLTFGGVRTATCPFCASPNFIERPASATLDPTFALGFASDHRAAHRQLDRWLASRSWFVDPRLKAATVDQLRGVYVPAYIYSAVARTTYRARIGEHYREQESYREPVIRKPHRPFKRGQRPAVPPIEWVTKTRTVTRTEYHPLSGTHICYVTDVVVTGSRTVTASELTRVGPFDFRQLRRFSPAVIAGWIAEEYAVAADDGMRRSRQTALDEVGERVRRFMPGDSYSDLQWWTTIEWESLDPVMIPLWVIAVRYHADRPLVRVVMNGQTGRIFGKPPLSRPRVAAAVIAAVAVIAIAAWALAARRPPPPEPAPPPPTMWSAQR